MVFRYFLFSSSLSAGVPIPVIPICNYKTKISEKGATIEAGTVVPVLDKRTREQRLLELDNVDLIFEEDALKAIAGKAIARKTGARGLRSIVEKLLLDVMFNIADYRGMQVIISKDVVEGKAEAQLKPKTVAKNVRSKKAIA